MLEMFLGALFISFAPIFVKLISLPPTLIGVYRCGFAGLFLLPWVLRKICRARKEPGNLWDRKALLWLLAAGLCFSLDLALWHRTIKYLGAGMGTIMANTQSLYLTAFGVLLFSEKLSRRFVLSLLFASCGIYILVGELPSWVRAEDYLPGVLSGLATGLCYASSMLCLKKAESAGLRWSAIERLGIFSLFTTAFLSVGATFEGVWVMPSQQDLLLSVALALLAQVGGWLCISRGLPKVPVSLAGLILLIQPALATVASAILFGERMDYRQASGALLTLIAVYMGKVPESKLPPKQGKGA